jgi:hypothetical protein
MHYSTVHVVPDIHSTLTISQQLDLKPRVMRVLIVPHTVACTVFT